MKVAIILKICVLYSNHTSGYLYFFLMDANLCVFFFFVTKAYVSQKVTTMSSLYEPRVFMKEV